LTAITIAHRMSDVAIIGAGELGGATAHLLARRGAASAVRLIDEAGRIAEGKALDIAQAAPIEGFATDVSGSTDVTRAAGSSVIVIADHAGGGEWDTTEGLLLLTRLMSVSRRAVILCAGGSHRELVERGVRELRIDRTRLFGSAPDALAAGARGLVALERNTSPQDIALSVLGVPPDQLVVPWESGAIAGLSITQLLDDVSRRGLSRRIARLWPPGPYALATAAVKIAEGVLGHSRRLACCFVAPERGAEFRTRTVALPVSLGPDGLGQTVMPPLNTADRVALDNAMML
jgi:malate dehydrogenase